MASSNNIVGKHFSIATNGVRVRDLKYDEDKSLKLNDIILVLNITRFTFDPYQDSNVHKCIILCNGEAYYTPIIGTDLDKQYFEPL